MSIAFVRTIRGAQMGERPCPETIGPAETLSKILALAESGAKKYAKNHGNAESAWSKLFPKPDREQASREMVKSFEAEHSLGNYNRYIPKKYQAKPATKRRAR